VSSDKPGKARDEINMKFVCVLTSRFEKSARPSPRYLIASAENRKYDKTQTEIVTTCVAPFDQLAEPSSS
jgi:hypothetical protein